MNKIKKNIFLFLTINSLIFSISCLTIGGSEILKRRFTPERVLSSGCKSFSINKAEELSDEKSEEMKDIRNRLIIETTTFFIIPIAIDTYLIYLISLQNGAAAFGYYGIGHIYISANMHPPKTILLKSWCGSPENPTTLPAEYLFFSHKVYKGESCKLDKEERILFTKMIYDFVGIRISKENEYDERIMEKITLYNQEETEYRLYCKYFLHYPGGEDKLRLDLQ